MNLINLPKARNKNILTQDLDKELLIYDLISNKAYSLNETSKTVYQNCDGKTLFADLKSKYNLTGDLIFLALDELKRKNLLETETNYQSPFAGMNRREVLRKVGFASMIALPVISSLVAPTAAMAQSSLVGLRGKCNSDSDCASSAPYCTNTPSNSAQNICCIGSISYYDTGSIVNSCSGGINCNAATFACQSNAGEFCCSGSATASCSSPNACECKCN